MKRVFAFLLGRPDPHVELVRRARLNYNTFKAVDEILLVPPLV
jgi:hypothetical protein